MDWLIKLLLCQQGFLSIDGAEGGGGGGKPAEEKPAEEKPVEEEKPSEEKPTEEKPEDKAKAEVAQLREQIANLEGKLSMVKPGTPAAPETVKDDLEEEVKLRREQLELVEKGELDAKYRPEIMSRLAAAEAKKVATDVMQSANSRDEFFGSWNRNLAAAYDEFPELKDKDSEFTKLARKLVLEDRGYQCYMKAQKADGIKNKVDFASLDPNVNLRCAREAHSILVKQGKITPEGKKISKPAPTRTALEGRSGQVPRTDEVDKLEKEAVDSGDPNAWTRYIKALDKKKAAVV